MRVIGVDPGYDRLGIAVLERTDGNESVLYSTCIETDQTDSLSERIYTAGTVFTELMHTYEPTIIGIETLFFNKNVKTAIAVAQARGALLYLGRQAGCTIQEFSPQAIKLAVTGHGQSDKAAVTMMVKRLVRNVPPQALDDEYDAIAVGVTTLAHNQ